MLLVYVGIGYWYRLTTDYWHMVLCKELWYLAYGSVMYCWRTNCWTSWCMYLIFG
jgi:hypothetical protein